MRLAHELHVDVGVVLLLAIPAERDLRAVRGKGRRVFDSRVRGQLSARRWGGRSGLPRATRNHPAAARSSAATAAAATQRQPPPGPGRRGDRLRLRVALLDQFLQLHPDVGHVLVAPGGVLAEAPGDDLLHVLPVSRPPADGGSFSMTAASVVTAESPWKGRRPLTISYSSDAEREDVGALVDRLALRLLGRHVGDGPHDAPLTGSDSRGHGRLGRGVPGGPLELRQPEVEHLHAALVADHDVRGLDVAVDDADRMRRRQGVGDLHRDLQRRR